MAWINLLPQLGNFNWGPGWCNNIVTNKEDVLVFKEPLLELTIHGHGSKYTVLSSSMKPQKFWLILYSWKGIANKVGPKIKYFCFPLSDEPIENSPDPK